MNPWLLFVLLIIAVVVVWAWMTLMELFSLTDRDDECRCWWTYDETTGRWHRDQDC